MGKASGLFILTAVAGLGIAFAMTREISDDARDAWWTLPATSQPTRGQPTSGQTAQGQPPKGDGSLAVASDGWRAFSQPASEAPEREAPPVAAPAPRPAPVVVTVAPRNTEPPAKSTAPTFAGDRVSLARELQRELKRVGCYDGEVNGTWTPLTRNAMKTFTSRVNAALPVEEPDVILLSLLQGHSDKVCGTQCPAGQGLAVDGRCVPNAILAQVKKAPPPVAVPAAAAPKVAAIQPPAPAITGWSATTTVAAPVAAPAAPAAPLDGRMALSGPTYPSTAAADAAAALSVGGASPTPPAAPKRAPATKTSSFGSSFLKQLDRQGSN